MMFPPRMAAGAESIPVDTRAGLDAGKTVGYIVLDAFGFPGRKAHHGIPVILTL